MMIKKYPWRKKPYYLKRRFKKRKKLFLNRVRRRIIRRRVRMEAYRRTRLNSALRHENSRVLRKRRYLPIFHSLSSQLLVYSRSYAAVFTQILEFLRQIKKMQNQSPIAYLHAFLSRAVPRLYLRDYRAGKNRLRIPVPANFKKRRASFLKQLLVDLRGRPEIEFYSRFYNEILDFNTQQGITYNKKLDTYIIAKQNNNYSRYAYKGKGYIKKNAVKKNKLSYI